MLEKEIIDSDIIISNSLTVLKMFKVAKEGRRHLLSLCTAGNSDVFLKGLSATQGPENSALFRILLMKGVSKDPISNIPGSTLLNKILSGENPAPDAQIGQMLINLARTEVIKGIRRQEDEVFLSDEFLDSEIKRLEEKQRLIQSSNNIVATMTGTSIGLRETIGSNMGITLRQLLLKRPGLETEINNLAVELSSLLDKYIPQDPS